MSERIKVGDTVRFKNIVDAGDEKARFVVIEDNGDRVLVRAISNLPIPPVNVFRTAELCKVD